MGICFTSAARGTNSNPSRTPSSNIGTSSNDSKNMVSSGFSSVVGRSQFSEAASVDVEESYPTGKIMEYPSLKEFSFTELKAATKNFKIDNLIGQGGFGKVYRGWVDEKTINPTKSNSMIPVAIKKLNSESVQGFLEWQAEVNFLGRLSHPNLVKLLGFCWEDKELLLVYEFMPKGSLENHLFRRGPSSDSLSWERRLKIAIDAARGMAFLHTSEKKIIYRDFKASNILLDESYNAKISDFGLAKLGPAGERTHVTTRIMGTYGYCAPEYIATGHLYVKSDVYGFGVVLLELMTGLSAYDVRRPLEKRVLIDWAKPILMKRKKVNSLMDARIQGQYSTKAAMEAGDLTLKCLETDHRRRPSMLEVLETLERIEKMVKPKESKISDLRSQNRQQVQFNNSLEKMNGKRRKGLAL